MHTLQEFIAFTKGWEYVISLICLALFIGFWRAFSAEPRVRRTAPARETAPAMAGVPRAAFAPVAGASINGNGQDSRCWEVKGCRAESRAICPAYKNPGVPCWQSKGSASTGVGLSSDCMGCRLFTVRSGAAA